MGRAHIIVSGDLLARINSDDRINKRVCVTKDTPFCGDTHYAEIFSLLLPDGYHGVQDIIVEGGGIVRFRKDCDV